MRLMSLFPKKPTKSAPSATRQRLQAAVARRTARTPSIEEEEEPTTSFKTALIIVLLLHVVAGGGILAFERIKIRHPSASSTVVSKKTAAAVPAASPAVAQPAKPQAVAAVAAAVPVKKPAAATPATATEVKDSGVLYTVAKGDKPVAIAKKLRVAYDDLLKLNKIEDPTKLRIGQKLHVPIKPRASAN